jgi:uncharacterized protein (TIGR03089 family)
MWTLLQGRRRTAGGLPLVTHVDATTGGRTELSAASLENAAAKVANALREEFELAPGDVVGIHLPVHWQRAAWCAGIWTAGCVVAPGSTSADLLVAGPDDARELVTQGHDGIAVVSLHPFGLPLADPLPPGCTDVTITVRQQPDAYLFDPPSPGYPALQADGAVLDQAGAVERGRVLGGGWGLDAGGRLLADDTLPLTTAWLAALATPLACAASVVLVSGVADLDQVAAQERTTARATL